MNDESWKQEANCKNMNPAWFFEEYENHQEEVDEACATCSVRKECLDYAIRIGAEGGFFARRYFGSSAKDKSKIRKSPDRKVKIQDFTV